MLPPRSGGYRVALLLLAWALGAASGTGAQQALQSRTAAPPHDTAKRLPGALTLARTISDCDGSNHTCDGLSYVVQARSYPASPSDLVVTMRGGGVGIWRWGPETAAAPSLALRSLALPGVRTEGQDSLGDLLVVVALNRGIVTLDYPSLRVRGTANISVTGALHCKLWRALFQRFSHRFFVFLPLKMRNSGAGDGATRRTFALITTGLTHATADRDYLVSTCSPSTAFIKRACINCNCS